MKATLLHLADGFQWVLFALSVILKFLFAHMHMHFLMYAHNNLLAGMCTHAHSKQLRAKVCPGSAARALSSG